MLATKVRLNICKLHWLHRHLTERDFSGYRFAWAIWTWIFWSLSHPLARVRTLVSLVGNDHDNLHVRVKTKGQQKRSSQILSMRKIGGRATVHWKICTSKENWSTLVYPTIHAGICKIFWITAPWSRMYTNLNFILVCCKEIYLSFAKRMESRCRHIRVWERVDWSRKISYHHWARWPLDTVNQRLKSCSDGRCSMVGQSYQSRVRRIGSRKTQISFPLTWKTR